MEIQEISELLAAAQAAHSNALAAYQDSLLADDPKAAEKAQAGVGKAAREVERCEARLAVAKDRERARAEKEAEAARAAGQAAADAALTERSEAGERIAGALKAISEALAVLDRTDSALLTAQQAGHISRDCVVGHNFGPAASRRYLESEFNQIINGPSSIQPVSFGEWVRLGNSTAKG